MFWGLDLLDRDHSAALDCPGYCLPALPPYSALMKDMWWRHNTIVCQICLWKGGSGRDLPVVVWVDGQIICLG